MAMQTTGIDVEAGGDDAPVVTGTPVEAGRENEAPVVTGAPVLSRQLSGAAVQQRAQQALTGPTAESPQKSSSDLFYSAAMQAILPVILLTNYYRQEWGDRYCSTDVAEWFFVFGWIGAASVLYAYLVNVWFWRIQWDDFARSSDEGKQKILKRLKRVQAPNTALAIANFVWFCVGQERIWGTHACDMDEYDMIMAMNSTVRPAARAPASRPPARPLAPHAPTRLPAHSRPAHSPPLPPSRTRAQNCTYGDRVLPLDPSSIECFDGTGCCYPRMHDFARTYSIICFVFAGLVLPCFFCFCCVAMKAASNSSSE